MWILGSVPMALATTAHILHRGDQSTLYFGSCRAQLCSRCALCLMSPRFSAVCFGVSAVWGGFFFCFCFGGFVGFVCLFKKAMLNKAMFFQQYMENVRNLCQR